MWFVAILHEPGKTFNYLCAIEYLPCGPGEMPIKVKPDQ